MKKLLITTLAAVSVGLCAKAEDTSTFTENGTSFDEEGLTVGDAFNPTDTYWTILTDTDDVFKITNVTYSADATKQHWDWTEGGEKALAIDTANPILRNVNPVPQDDTTIINPPQPVTTPVFFDSVVQFTATDVAPSMENNTTDKLAVWLYTSPDDVSATNPGLFGETSPITNVAVTAGYLDGATLQTKNYITDIEVEPDTWHRLTIKSFKNGINDLLFNIWVDRTQVSGKETFEGQTTITDFLSRISDAVNSDTYNELQGVAFDGKGAVDDIVFTTTEPDFAKEPEEPTVETYTLNIAGENFTCQVFTDSEWDNEVSDLTAINTEYKTLWLGITPDENYELESIKLGNQTIALPEYDADENVYYLDELQISTGDIDNGAEFTLTITMKEKTGGGSGEDPEVPAKPTIGGDAVETAEAFIAAANSGVTIKVPTDWTLDGNTLKYADGNVYATFADYYTVELATDGTVTLQLNDSAKPTINETATDADDAIVLTDTTVSLGVTNAKAGLWYGVQAYSDAACTTKVGDVTGWAQAQAESTTVTVTATKPEGDKAFFKVVVDDQDHSSEEQN